MPKEEGGQRVHRPLGQLEEPTAPFHVTSLDVTGPHPRTPRANRHLLTFIDHFSKSVEAFPVPDQTAETFAQVYATQVVTRHGTGSKLITDQGPAFMLSFFNETCKILGIRTTRTSYHPASNVQLERWHRSLHNALSHYVNAANTNWDVLVKFFLMAFRATPHVTTGYSPFFLLNGREMTLPSNVDLKAKVTNTNSSHSQRLASLKASLKLAYESVRCANRKSHDNNKKYYDRRAKHRQFQAGDYVYLYSPATKLGLPGIFHKVWTGPFKVTAKILDLNYEILGHNDRKLVVHVNILKAAHGYDAQESKPSTRSKKRPRKDSASSDELIGVQLGARPLLKEVPQENDKAPSPPLCPSDSSFPTHHVLDTPMS